MINEQVGNSDLLKQLNCTSIYRLIEQKGPISRIQITEMSPLAPASISKITRQLLENGLIKEVEHQASTGGRRAVSLITETTGLHSIAIRLGRDYIQLSLFDLSAKELISEHHHMEYAFQDKLLIQLKSQINLFITKYQKSIKRLIAISIVLPGLVDPKTGIVNYIPNTEINTFPLADLISEQFTVPCFVGNDIKSLALAEHYFGASKDCLDSVLISIHRGTGAGIIIDGNVFLGHNQNLGEIGHIQIDTLGDKCQCGNFGCLETVASEPAIIAKITSLLKQGYLSTLSSLDKITMMDICNAANNGDELATQTLQQVGYQLGKVIAMTVNLLNPQKIIIAGTITHANTILLPAIRNCIQKQTLKTFQEALPIVISETYHQPTLGAFSIVKRAMLNGSLLPSLLENSTP